jgi:isopenicillin N synthase-like dioxygenase
MSAPAIPVLDLASLAAPAAQGALAAQLRTACLDSGFFRIINHGIAQALLDAQLAWSRRLFALPPAVLAAVSIGHSTGRFGHEPIATQVLDAGSAPDLKESFYIGRGLGPEHPYVREGLHNHGPNQWPAGIPGLREHSEHYFAAVRTLAEELMRLLALSLALPATYFDAMMVEPMPVLRLIHYPPHPANAAPDMFGAGAHTDWGALTLLLQDDCGGLQIQGAAGAWLDAEPVAGSFIVNLGDMIARWTNGQYRSTRHRVINRIAGRDRYSTAFFYNPDFKARIACLPTCTDAGNPPRYAPCTAGEHLREMYRRSYAAAPAA